ncbi:MAG: site-specific DNA-methyltransferase [Clostridiales bacterium]|nr:site-specific DNA-methyltransferase [Clostridiales bacterium]
MIDFRNEDCMIGMARYPDKYFDLAIVDPPYYSGPERRNYYGQKVSKTGVFRSYNPSTRQWTVPDKTYFNELIRVSKHYIIWGCNYFDYPFQCGRIIWDKCNGKSTFSDAEIAATDLSRTVRLFPFMWNGMMQGKSIEEGRVAQGNKKLNEIRIHPTQKPVALYEWLLTKFAEPGWRIIDTHVGSGSSLIACSRMGYEATGFEIDIQYYLSAAKRIEEDERNNSTNQIDGQISIWDYEEII